MYGPKDGGFYITLPSNASHNVFKDNTSDNFRVDLAQHIDLDGQWEVAVTEISYPHTWYNIPQEEAYFEWRSNSEKNRVSRQKFQGGYYSGVQQFRSELEGFFRKINSDIYIVYNGIQKKFDFQAGGQTHVRFKAPMAYVIGLKEGEWFEFNQKMAHYPADLRAGFYHLYCYSDVVRPQLVGDAYAPLLRTVDIKGGFGDIVTQHFNPAYYLPVAKQHIENIQIQIKTDQNKPVKFTYGKTIVTLHFRPVATRNKELYSPST